MAYSQIKNAATQMGARGGIYRTGASTLYELMSDQPNYDNNNPAPTRMLKSTDNGSTWVEVGVASRPVMADYSTVGYASDIDKNGKIHIIYQYADPNNVYINGGWKYTTFNTTTDTWGTTELIYTPTPPTNGNLVIGYQTLAVDSNNVPHVVFTYSFAVRNGQSAQTVAVFTRYMNRIGGSWTTNIAVNNPSINQTYADIIIDNNNIPIFSSNEDNGDPNYETNVYGTVAFYYADQNNPTGFTRIVVANAAGYASPTFPLVQDDLNNLYIAHQAKTGYPTFYKHKYGDPYTVWSSFAHPQKGRDIALTVSGRNIFMGWAKTDADGYSNRTLSWDVWNGQFWQGIQYLEAAGSNYRLIYLRYSPLNQYQPATVDMTYTTFPQALFYNRIQSTTDVIGYIDASDAAATDPNSAWSSPAEAFNGDFTAGATQSITSTQSSGFLKAEGTNIPVTSGPITQVRARVYGKGASDSAAAYGGYTTLSVPTGGWTWQKINDLETKINTTAGVSGTPAQIQANIYTDGLAQNLGVATYQTGGNGPQALTVYRVEFAVSYVAFMTFTPTHGTDTLKHTLGERSHNTDTNRRKTNNTKIHFTSAIKKLQPTRAHTTSSNKKGTNTRSFSTSSNKRKAAVTTVHLTDALKRAAITRSHLTDANKKVANNLISFTTDALKRTLQTRAHNTSANLRKVNSVSQTTSSVIRKTNTRTHLTDANKRRTGIVKTHTTGALIRKTNAVVHTTNSYIQPSYGTLSTDYFVVNFIPTIITDTDSHSTDSNLRRAAVKSHSTDSLKRKATSVSQSTDALIRKGITKTHSTDTVKRKTNTKSHTTDALKRASLIKTHTTDALKRKQFTRSHTADSFKRALQYKTHTTDALRRKQLVKTQTTDALKRKAFSVYQTTDANKKRAYYKTHTTDSVLRTVNYKSHTTDALKRTVTPKTHNTDALLRAQKTKFHYTDAAILYARRRNFILNPSLEVNLNGVSTHGNLTTSRDTTTSKEGGASLRVDGLNNGGKYLTFQTGQWQPGHTYTFSMWIKQTLVSPTDKTSIDIRAYRSGGPTEYHPVNITGSVGDWIRVSTTATLPTDCTSVQWIVIQDAAVLPFTVWYDGIMVEEAPAYTQYFDGDSINAGWRGTPENSQSYSLSDVYTRTHSTDAIKRKQNVVSHSTDSLKRRAVPVTHTTDALKRKTNSLSHTTDALKRTRNTRTHLTDANRRKANAVSHATSANKRKALTRTHTTDALKRTTGLLKSHTTSSVLRKQLTKFHRADAFKRTGTELSHNTSTLKRKTNTRSHSTSSMLRKAFIVSHSTDANKRKALLVAHTTDANTKKTNLVIVHTTDSLKRQQFVRSHTTNALKRKAYTKLHTTSANKRKGALTKLHTTSANKRQFFVKSHTTSANLRKFFFLFSTTDANKRRSNLTIYHNTDANLQATYIVAHSTDTIISNSRAVYHSTSSSLYSLRGTKMVLVNGTWKHGVAKVLIDGEWVIAQVRYFDGNTWPLTNTQ